MYNSSEIIGSLVREMLNEGRYDGAITRLSRHVVNSIKMYIELRTPGEPFVRRQVLDNQTSPIVFAFSNVAKVETNFSTILNSESYSSGGGFGIQDSVIVLNIEIGENFSMTDMNKLVSNVKSTIAHEVHHSIQLEADPALRYKDKSFKRPKDDPNKYHDFSSIPKIRAYFSDILEVEAFTIGLKKKAKHLRVPFESVVDEHLLRVYNSYSHIYKKKHLINLRFYLKVELKTEMMRYHEKRYGGGKRFVQGADNE